ncbi:sarcosine oxidase subunit delta [Thetidibacter halocola]|uniref:Sarcosine oxidase subunit delta n=1 Tax=Thetidibacter halocola TaxID=2827239 RepID=A0A8J8B7U5_9RHOB|nr:sarcosine oxidase subunit delta [Thetidibacter halocola]MBS0124069.1 sarcosine oxidase subunit delta [Thetidibacter halocola]
MLLIDCPFCGKRTESEFAYGGPALAPRPDPAALTDAEWVDWLTVPPNPLGWVEERWWHARGCGAWLTLRRHTVTHEIAEVRHGR